MDDTTKAIIERLKTSGKTWAGSTLTDDGYKDIVAIIVNNSYAAMVVEDATPARARRFAELAGVDVSDIK